MDITFIISSIAVFLGIILVLVVILLTAKRYLMPSGTVAITINDKEKVEVAQGSSLLSTLSENGVYLSSACGGKGSCGQCKVQVVEGGGEILDVEKGHFTRKEIKEGFRLGCQCKVKGDISIQVPESVLGVKEYECTVVSNNNVASFIKEFIVALPEGEHMDFIPGSYAQIKIPTFKMDFDKDIDKASIGERYIKTWEQFGILNLKCENTEPTIRAYSMANYPAEGDRFMLTVRIATPPFRPKSQGGGMMDVMPGIASSYIFSLKPGDKVTITYIRDKRTHTATLTLRNAQGTTSLLESVDVDQLGVALRPLTTNEKEELALSSGLVVTAVRDGKMKDVGVTKGLILLQINDKVLNTPEDFNEAVKTTNMSNDRVLWIRAKTQSGINKSFTIELDSNKAKRTERRR